MVTLMSRCPATSWAVWRHAVHDRVGDQDATEVVRDETQRPAAGVGESGPGEGVGDEFAERGSCYRAVLAAVATLEQQRDRRVPHAFVIVVGDNEWDGTVLVADAADDSGK